MKRVVIKPNPMALLKSVLGVFPKRQTVEPAVETHPGGSIQIITIWTVPGCRFGKHAFLNTCLLGQKPPTKHRALGLAFHFSLSS